MTSPRNTAPTGTAPTGADSITVATAHERRAKHNAETSRRYGQLLSDHGCGDPKAAARLGRVRQKVAQLRDPEDATGYSVVDMRMDDPAIAAEMARFGMEPHGYEVRKAHRHDTIADDIDHLAEMNVEDAGLVAEIMRAFGDESLTAAEASKIKGLLRESIERREALIARCDEAIQKRVSPLRRLVTP